MTTQILINDRPLRAVFQSNAPWTPGGYGVTTALVAPRLRDRLGIDVAISATYGHYGGKLTWRGIDVYAPGNLPFGNDIAAANAKQHKADILITHQDVWTQLPDKITEGGTRWVSWQPLDSEPVAPTIIERLKGHCYQPIALSHFGAMQAALAGLPMPTVIQGVDTNVFVPNDRGAARTALGWPQDAFIVGMVARNSGYPSRKAYPQQIEAWAQFAKQHGDALLYVHAAGDERVDPEATPIVWQLERHGLMDRVIWASPYALNTGYKTEDMATRYQAMDLLLCVSMSEGFGIPLIEAQACGTPVLTGAWTAMLENCYAGWLVNYLDSEPWPVSPLECFWRLPRVDAISKKLEYSYNQLQNTDDRHALALLARDGAVRNHDQDMLIDTQWRPVLEDIARRIEAEPYPWHVHRWAGYGHSDATGAVIAACQTAGCTAEVRLTPDGEKDVYETGAPIVVDDITLDIVDDPIGGVARSIASEITHTYRLQDLTFQPGDIILDIGAHVGVVSCYLAKKWPETRIVAFEPVPANYERLVRNLRTNGCENVATYNQAVTDEYKLRLCGDPSVNTGSYSAYSGGRSSAAVVDVATQHLPSYLAITGTGQIALLKLDCEGGEYQILQSMADRLSTIDTLIMEVHENAALKAQFGSGARLIADMERQIPLVRASLIAIPDTPMRDVRVTAHAESQFQPA